MNDGMLNMVLAFGILAALSAMARLRRSLLKCEIDSLNEAALGLSLVATVSLVQAIKQSGVILSFTQPSNAILFDTVCWSLTLLGMVLTVSGTSQWLPVVRDLCRSGRTSQGQLELLKRTHQLSSIEARPHRLLPGIMELLLATPGVGGVALMRGAGKKTELVATRGLDADLAEQLSGVDLSESIWSGGVLTGAAGEPLSVTDQSSEAVLSLPIVLDETCRYLILVWSTAGEFESELSQNIKIAAELVGQRLKQAARDSELAAPPAGGAVSDRIWGLVSHLHDPEAMTRGLGEAYLHHNSTNCLSVEIVFNDTASRYTIGPGGQVLREINLPVESLSAHTRSAVESGCPAEFSVPAAPGGHSALERTLGARENGSILCLPSDHGRPRVVLTLASDRAHAFEWLGQTERVNLVALLSQMARAAAHRQEAETACARARELANLVENLDEAPTLSEAFKAAAGALRRIVSADLVRINTLQADGGHLTSRALSARHEIPVPTPAGGRMPLAELPYHQMVCEHGRTMLINQESTGKPVTPGEATMMWSPQLKSALIVPAKVNGRVVATVSMADCRDWESFRFDRRDIATVKMVASLLSMNIQAGAMKRRTGRVHLARGENGEIRKGRDTRMRVTGLEPTTSMQP